MWLVIVTLATVGYGDYYLKTFNGRIVGFIITFWGTFVISYFVVTVTNILTFSAPEEKSYVLLQRLHHKEQLKEYAVNVLSSAFRHKVSQLENKDHQNDNKVERAHKNLRANTMQFQKAAS
jgi:hypothetical protein